MANPGAQSSASASAGLRVLHLITRMDMGGSATNTAATCVRLADQHGCHVTLASGPSSEMPLQLARRLAESGVSRLTLPHLRRNPNPIGDVAGLVEVLALVRRLRPAVLHTHTSKAGVLGRLAGWLLRVPVVVHTPHGHIFYGYFGGFRMRVFAWLERVAAHWCDYIISLTDRETTDYLDRRIGRPEQYVTIPSGVPLERFTAPGAGVRERVRTALGIGPEEVVFITVARLEPVKGVDVLVDAWRLLAAAAPRLLIVGDGGERPRLEHRAGDAGLSDRIVFLGARADVPDLLHAADAFVLASRNEGMGRVYVEAMAAGLPVVGTDVGGVGCVVQDGVSGILTPPETPAAIAAAVARLAADPAERGRMGEAGRRAVYPEFDEAFMVERIARLYAQALDVKIGQSSS